MKFYVKPSVYKYFLTPVDKQTLPVINISLYVKGARAQKIWLKSTYLKI